MRVVNKEFPQELVDLILEYVGYHVWRNGKFINKIHTPRRTVRQKRPLVMKRPVFDGIILYSISVHQRYYAHGEIQFHWVQEYHHNIGNPDWRPSSICDDDDDDDDSLDHDQDKM